MPNSSPIRVRSPLLWLLLPFAAGIAVAHLGSVPLSLGFGLGLTIVALAAGTLALRNHPRVWAATLLLGLFGAGSLHYSIQRNRLPEWELLPNREVVLTVEIERVFGPRDGDSYQNFMGRVDLARAPVSELWNQQIYVSLKRFTGADETIQRGAVVEVIGHLEPLPRTIGDESFLSYLIDSGHNFRLRQARWQRTVAPPSAYAQLREKIKQRAAATLARGLEHRPAITGALHAMLLGERHALPPDARELFLRSGTMHLFAISGLHIGVIALAINGALRLMRLPRLAAFAGGSVVLLGYVDLIGLSPSAIRAWIMITCFHGARVLRAPGNPVAAISTSALIVLLWDPMQLFSAGFQMSYTIVFVLLLHGLPLIEHLQPKLRLWRDLPTASLHPTQRWIQAKAEMVVAAAALTWAASLIGVITGVGIFGWFTPFAFVANLALVPLAWLAITAGFTSVVLGLAGAALPALLFNHASGLVLWFMYGVLEYPLTFAAGIPATFRTTWWGEMGMIGVLTTIVLTHEFRSQAGRLQWWAPTLITVLVLVTGLCFP